MNKRDEKENVKKKSGNFFLHLLQREYAAFSSKNHGNKKMEKMDWNLNLL